MPNNNRSLVWLRPVELTWKVLPTAPHPFTKSAVIRLTELPIEAHQQTHVYEKQPVSDFYGLGHELVEPLKMHVIIWLHWQVGPYEKWPTCSLHLFLDALCRHLQ